MNDDKMKKSLKKINEKYDSDDDDDDNHVHSDNCGHNDSGSNDDDDDDKEKSFLENIKIAIITKLIFICFGYKN